MVPHLKALYKRGQIKGKVFGSFGKVERLIPPLVLVLGMLALAMLSFSWRADELPANTVNTASSTVKTTRTAATTTAAITATDTIPDSGDLDLETVRATVRTERAARADSASTGQQGPLRLLLASHSRLFWYEPDTKTTSVLHEGEGVHYGVIPGEGGSGPNDPLTSVWFALRPHNWHPQSSEEFLVEVDATTGTEISRTKISSRFTHDVARMGDRVFICSTESGEVLQLDYPTMLEVRRMALFTRQQHVNSLAPLEPNSLWAMLHNLGSSTLVRVSWEGGEPAVVGVIEEVGTKAHAIIEWREWLLLLDSDGGALVRVKNE